MIFTSTTQQPLAERWNGTTWRIMSTAPEIAGGGFAAVSCSSTTLCTAVGTQGTDLPTVLTLAERWDGTTWSVQATPNPPTADEAELHGISCPSDLVCFAVGTAHDASTSSYHAIAAVWRAGAWQAVPVPEPAGAPQTGLNGVDCGTTRRCQAVGSADEPGHEPLVEGWDGSALSLESVVLPPNESDTVLAGVSCSSGLLCRAVGRRQASPNFPVATVFRNGAWSDQSNGLPRGDLYVDFAAVSCPSGTTCTAVGHDYTGSGGGQYALIERWANGLWTRQSAAPA